MSAHTASMMRKPLVVAMLVALLAPGMAVAATAKEKELEARVAQLEAQVQALLATQQAQQAQVSEAQANIAEVKAAQPAPLPEGQKPIQDTLKARSSAFFPRTLTQA